MISGLIGDLGSKIASELARFLGLRAWSIHVSLNLFGLLRKVKATFDQVLLRVMTFCTFQIDLQMNVT